MKNSIQYLAERLIDYGLFEEVHDLAEIVVNKDKSYPAVYKGKGEYQRINGKDASLGIAYIRLNGDITDTESEEQFTSCQQIVKRNLPLKLVAIVPRAKIDCDDNYSELLVLSDLKRIIQGLKKSDHQAIRVELDSVSSSTNGSDIMKEESDLLKDVAPSYIYVSIKFNLIIHQNVICLPELCYY